VQLYLDSANIDEIAYALESWQIDGITTNPRHVGATGKTYSAVLKEIADLVQGTNTPVSVQVNPRLTDWTRIVDEALKLRELSPNFVVKVGACEDGLRAVRELAVKDVPTNVTLVFSVAQAWHAARAGAMFVSPFIGWKEQYGDDAGELIADIALMLDNFGYSTQIIAAAMRNARQIGIAAVEGAHVVTASASVIRDSFRNPYTTMGEQLFGEAWDAMPEQ
jgi:transaldolase